MAFRDDRDALLARADALEREAERLRRENESLREAADAERAAAAERAETERAAEAERAAAERESAGHRAAVDQMAARAAKPAGTARRSHARPKNPGPSVLERSLSPTWPRVVDALGFIVLLPGLVGVAFALYLASQALGLPEYVAMPVGFAMGLAYFIAHIVGTLRVSEVVARAEARRERRWLAALPLPLDVEGYVAVMSATQNDKVLEVRVAFCDPPAAPARETIATAARGVRRVASAAWSGDELVISSPRLETSFRSKNASWCDNVKVHRWFRHAARKALIPIAHAYPMASVRVS